METRFRRFLYFTICMPIVILSTPAFAQGRPSYIWEGEFWNSPKIYISLVVTGVLGLIFGVVSALSKKRSKEEERKEEKKEEI